MAAVGRSRTVTFSNAAGQLPFCSHRRAGTDDATGQVAITGTAPRKRASRKHGAAYDDARARHKITYGILIAIRKKLKRRTVPR